MNGIKTLGSGPNFFFWPFKWGINWYYPNRERYKHFIQTFRFL